MLQLPAIPRDTFKLAFFIHDKKGSNYLEMLPQVELDLQGQPELLTMHALNDCGQVLMDLAYENETWVSYDPLRHSAENYKSKKAKPKKAKPKKTKPKKAISTPCKSKPMLEEKTDRKPIPQAGLDTVRQEGRVIETKVSTHVKPMQNM